MYSDFIYPPAVTKKILGIGLSVYTIASAFQKALGSTPFSVVRASEQSASYWIALSYVTLGVLLGTLSLVYCAATSSLRFCGYLGAYLLAFSAVSLLNSPQSLWMQVANVFTYLGVSLAAMSAWLRHRREHQP
ncbi:hypothetical protein [Streptomyces albogriseolus]|uniref:hypothetical protein n=1 Tax=Streptomyces albogriseolus TaxID=1887 RepID=UPI00345FE61A